MDDVDTASDIQGEGGRGGFHRLGKRLGYGEADLKRKMRAGAVCGASSNLKVAPGGSRALPAYDLVVAKGGPKMEISKGRMAMVPALGKTHPNRPGAVTGWI